jgi:hypothetical protein
MKTNIPKNDDFYLNMLINTTSLSKQSTSF